MHIALLTACFAQKVRQLRDEEEGLALTEYLILLGLLVGGVIVSVTTFGNSLGTAWGEWATWIGNGTGLGAPATGLTNVP